MWDIKMGSSGYDIIWGHDPFVRDPLDPLCSDTKLSSMSGTIVWQLCDCLSVCMCCWLPLEITHPPAAAEMPAAFTVLLRRNRTIFRVPSNATAPR